MSLKIGKKDVAILKELDQDVRASFSQIGKKTRLSKEVVQYRIKRMEEQNVIAGYWAIFNFGFGYTYKILIKNRSLSGELKKQFEDFVSKQKRISWFANTEGNFDYIITIFARNNEELVLLLLEIQTKFGSHFQEKHLLKSYKANITNEKYLYPEGKYLYDYKIDLIAGNKIQDETEDKILTVFSLNARSKYSEIAKKVGITPEAVSYRFKDIMKRGLISGLKVRINLSKLGIAYYHMFISLQNQEKMDELKNYYTEHPDCNTVMQHLGYYDLHIEIMLPETKTAEFMENFLGKFGDSVASYELLRIRKEHLLNILR